ncbi:MAG: DUF2948 family protein [Candidatus Puniceispirillaceae bacterium]
MREHSPLKLMARSGEDIPVLSALLQDALLAGADMQYIAAEKAFICLLNRYCREAEKAPQRRLCGLKIGQVEKVQTKGMQRAAQQFYNLLSIAYEEAGNGLILTFSGGAAIRLFIGEITITLRDVAEAHPSFARPVHE